ncbi:MAG: hypothetical protein NTX03_07790 [Bacteroidetes bacterium]|nr:hypothetical protein [Bacteroidota bacterium]
MKEYFIPGPEGLKNNFIINFDDKLPDYQAKYGFSNDEVTALHNGALNWVYIYAMQNTQKVFGKTTTDYKKVVLNGPKTGNPPNTVPVFTAPAPPATLVFNVLGIIQGMAARIKVHPAYSVNDAIALGIIGPEQGNPDDPATWKPHITVQRQGDFVEILWGWEGHPADGMEIQVDRTNAGWGTIAIDPDPNYTDTFNVNALPNPTQWKFRGIYRKNGVQVGQWSDVMVVAVP